VQVARLQSAVSKLAFVSIAAMGPTCRHLQGVAKQGYVTKYGTNVGKG
jgi:hypothetical protein